MKYILRYLKIFSFLITISYANSLISQESKLIKDYRFGIFAGANYLNHSTNIPIIWGADYCGIFEDGTNSSFQVGLNFSYNIYEQYLWADVRLNYANIPAYFERISSDFKVFNPQKMNYEPLYLKQEFNAKTGYLMIEPGLIIHPYLDLPFKAKLSLSAGNPLISNNYETSEEIVSPKTYTYEDQTQKMTTQSGKLSNAGTSLFGMFSVIFERKIGTDLYLNADVYYAYPINSNLSDYEWKVNKIGMNIGIEYAFDSEYEPKPERKIIDTIPKEEEKVQEKLPEFVKANIEFSNEPITLRETVVTQTYPILPYIFFDSSAATLNSKYLMNDISSFDEKSIPKESLGIYYAMLNIIGSRLSKNKSSIEIVGMTDGEEMPAKEERISLAKKRAENVSYYLMTKWGIDKSRIKISTRDIPKLATSNLYEEGNVENRRVEIYADDNDILKPLVHSKFKEYELINDNVKLDLLSNVPNELSKISLQFMYNDNVIYENNYNSWANINEIISINDKLKESLKSATTNNEEIKVKVSAYQNDSIKIEKVHNLAIRKESNNFELGRLNLIVFDFDKFDITDLNKNIIKSFVANSIYDNSNIKIIGSTDRLGEKDYNFKLSQDRANETYKYLLTLKPNSNYVEVKGIGDSKLPYDNNLPEGRFYCRTVLIEVTTPIK